MQDRSVWTLGEARLVGAYRKTILSQYRHQDNSFTGILSCRPVRRPSPLTATVSKSTESSRSPGEEPIVRPLTGDTILALPASQCNVAVLTDLNNDSHCRDFSFVPLLSPCASLLYGLGPLMTNLLCLSL